MPINFVLLLLASLRWGNKMLYNTAWTASMWDPPGYTPRIQDHLWSELEFERRGNSFLSAGKVTWKYATSIRHLYLQKFVIPGEETER